jgi:hypothetical protein
VVAMRTRATSTQVSSWRAAPVSQIGNRRTLALALLTGGLAAAAPDLVLAMDDEHELPPRFLRVELLLLAAGIAAVSIIARSVRQGQIAVGPPDECGSPRRSPAGTRSCRMWPVSALGAEVAHPG